LAKERQQWQKPSLVFFPATKEPAKTIDRWKWGEVLSFPGRASSYPWREGAVNQQVLANLWCLLSQGNCFRHRRSHGQVEGCQKFNLEKQPLQQRFTCLVKKMSGKKLEYFRLTWNCQTFLRIEMGSCWVLSCRKHSWMTCAHTEPTLVCRN
jgi:hypothetical protein